MLVHIKDAAHFEEVSSSDTKPTGVFFYSDASEKSKRALAVLEDLAGNGQGYLVCVVNASKVRDLHPRFGVDTVPSLVVLRDGRAAGKVVGLQTREFYEAALSGASPAAAGSGGERPAYHRVVVYTSNTCPWCAAVKTYLRKHGIRFREVNVSNDEKAARELYRRSGQMGVPQTDIDGEIIVGFDKARLNAKLGIRDEGA